MGSGLAQDIPEQKRGQLLGRYGGQLHFGGNGDGLSGSGRVHGGLGGCGVKLRPCLLRKNGVGLGVIGGVFHLSGDLFMNFLGGLGLGRKDGSLDIYLGMTLLQGCAGCIFQSGGGNRQAVLGQRDFKTVLRDLVGCIRRFPGKGLCQLLHPLCKNCLIRVQGNPLGAPAPHQVGQKVPAICQKAGLRLAQIKYKLGAAVVVQVASNSKSFIGDGVSWCIAIEDVSLRRGLSVAGFVGQRQIEIQRLPGDCLPQFPGRLRRGQSTHGDTVDSRIRIKGPQRPGIGAQAEICARQCQHDHAQSDIKALPALFQAGAALFLHTGFVDLFHEAPPAVP